MRFGYEGVSTAGAAIGPKSRIGNLARREHGASMASFGSGADS